MAFDVVSFLCFDQPIVIKVIAIMLIKGCSSDVKRRAGSFICPKTAFPKGETKYKTSPKNMSR